MAYRIVLVPVLGDPADQHALELTRAITHRMHTHIVGIHVRDPIGLATSSMIDAGYLTAGAVEHLENSGRQQAAVARDRFRQWQDAHAIPTATSPPATAKVTAEWNEVQASIADEIARRARSADLTVLARSGRQYAVDGDQALHGALLDSGRPVLIVPQASAAALFDTVVIAWNDSREAAHAVAAAWSLIGRARRLIVLIGGQDEALRHGAERFVAHLAWRGYAPATVVADAAADVGSSLLLIAEREKAGLIVMGAYTHSRLRHFVFGGATSFVLRHTTIPVLMAH